MPLTRQNAAKTGIIVLLAVLLVSAYNVYDYISNGELNWKSQLMALMLLMIWLVAKASKQRSNPSVVHAGSSCD